MSFEELVTTIEKFRDDHHVLFVLDKIDTLEKNGRLSTMKAKIVRALNLKLILEATDEGKIDLADKARGTKKALKKMVDRMGTRRPMNADSSVVIAHCNAQERAEDVKVQIQQTYGTKDVKIVSTKGLSSTYANVGGVIVAFI